MAFDPTASYLNAAHVEREIILSLWVQNQLGTFQMPVATWNNMWSALPDAGVARRKAFEGAWAMIFIPQNQFGCPQPPGCWGTTSPRLGQVYQLLLVSELTPCDPFGEYVNWIAYPEQVPPPC